MNNFMKTSLFFLLISGQLQAFDLFLNDQKITTVKMDEMNVSESCLLEKKRCEKFLHPKTLLKVLKDEKLAGNPASSFCQQSQGTPVILTDSAHNEFDYCLFNKKYYVDSWNYYRGFKK